MRDWLRRRLTQIVEPPAAYHGRHHPNVPIPPATLSGFVVEEWVQGAWARIAERHNTRQNKGES